MSTTLRTPESYLDEVAQEVNYKSFDEMINLRMRFGSVDASVRLIRNSVDEAMRRMCEDAFKAQKDIASEHAKMTNGIDSITNAPTPFEIDKHLKQ